MTPAEFNYPIPRELLKAYAEFAGEAEDTAQLAALMGIPEAELVAITGDPVRFAELEAYRVAHEMRGEHLGRRVTKGLLSLLGVLEKHIAEGCDIDAALEMIKPLIRLREVAERTRLAEKDSGDHSKRAVFQFIINGVEVGGARKPKDVSDVVDVQAVQVPTIAGGAL